MSSVKKFLIVTLEVSESKMLLRCVPELRYKKWLNSNITCGTKTIGRIVLFLSNKSNGDRG
jgi:hypothetical protein